MMMQILTPNEEVLKAVTVATRAHQGHFRKDGSPYISHVVRVALRLNTSDPQLLAVALLHDTVEDTSVTLDELKELGFSQVVIDAVDAITKRPGEQYQRDFIERICKNPIARAVKMADIADNLEDQAALDPEEAEFLRRRYTKALERLVRDGN